MVERVPCITDLTNDQIEELFNTLAESSYRVKQLQRWVYRMFALSFDEMSDLPVLLRKSLAQKFRLHSLTPVHKAVGGDGTVKMLFELDDGKTIESTLMSHPVTRSRCRYTICISSQVGCPVGCPFCATGQQGFERNLTPGELIDQVLYFARYLRDRLDVMGQNTDKIVNPVTNLVFMGMGEPLANYDALWQAIKMLNSSHGLGLGARSMVISTSGLVPQIKRLSKEELQVGLAISLHASDNALRNKLVPINKKYPLEELIPACREYFMLTGRRPTFEYALFNGVNDSIRQARSLAHLLRDLNCHVNLIVANSTANPGFKPAAPDVVIAFERELKRLHIACTLRQSKGLDIDAGCGQLRSHFMKSSQ